MKKEKAIRINLPDGAEYRRVEVTDGGISIIYAEETAIDNVKVSKTVSKVIPKPTRLVGGTKVYQKEGLPYWYCRIKDGRDEFMHLYFDDLTKDDILYTEDGKKRNFVTKSQKEFRADVMNALNNMPEEGFRWIPVYEPSKGDAHYIIDDGRNIQFVSGKNVLLGINPYNWARALQTYSPENGSRMSSITTYFLLLLRLLKDGFATIEQLADDSKEIGHYWNSKSAKHDIEKTGKRQIGGLYGFAGNTFKIVKDSEAIAGFSFLGSSCYINGSCRPLAAVSRTVEDSTPSETAVGLLELTK